MTSSTLDRKSAIFCCSSGQGNIISKSFNTLKYNLVRVPPFFWALQNSRNLLLVLPAGKAAHIESGIAYGLGKKCYAIGEYEATDTLYNIFEEIFSTESELEKFLREYN